jgi:Transposase DDE domain
MMYQDQIILDGVPLRGARYLEQMASCLARLHDVGTAHDKAGNRQFFCDQYVGLLLLYFFNPTVRTLRGMRKLTDLGSVQRRLKCQRVSLSSLSEAGSAFDAEPVREIFKELSAHMPPTRMLNQHHALRTLTAVDGSLLPALPRMVWALWLNEHHHAAKLHLHFEVARGIPVDASITTGQGSEVRQLRQHLQAGRLYVLDRGYACQDLLVDIQAARASYIVRVKECTAFTTARQLPIAPNASAAGVVRDVIVERLGSGHHKRKLFEPVRLVEIQTDASRLMLLTDQLEMPADLIALAYRHRWSIELFFRWFKCILGCRHLLGESLNALSIQVYSGLIASLLLSIWANQKPTRRTFEMVCHYMAGWATEEELQQHLNENNKQPSGP